MKTYLIIFSLFFIDINCGFLDNVLEKKEDSKNPDLLKKIVTDLKDDGKIIMDNLTGAFKKNSEGNKEDSENKKEPENIKPEDPKAPESAQNSPLDKSKVENVEVTTLKTPEDTSKLENGDVTTTIFPEVNSTNAQVVTAKGETDGASPKTDTKEDPAKSKTE